MAKGEKKSSAVAIQTGEKAAIEEGKRKGKEDSLYGLYIYLSHGIANSTDGTKG